MKITHILSAGCFILLTSIIAHSQDDSRHWQIALQGDYGRAWSPSPALVSNIPWSMYFSRSSNEHWDLTLRAAVDYSRHLSSYHSQYSFSDTIDGIPLVGGSLRTENNEHLRIALIPGFRYRPFERESGPFQPILGLEVVMGWYVNEVITRTNDRLLTYEDYSNYERKTIVEKLTGNSGGGIGLTGLLGMEWRPWSGLVIAAEAGPSVMWSVTDHDYIGTWTNTTLSGPEETESIYSIDQTDTGFRQFDFTSILSMSVRLGWEL